jgi:Tol biopolymer transport system component
MIVFANGGIDDRVHDIYVMRSDGSDRRLVTSDGRSPQFLPNGRVIIFTRSVEGRHQIFSIRIDGTALRQLTHGPHGSFDPAVHPKGRLIAFTSSRRRGDIFTMRPDGSRERLLISGKLVLFGGASSDADPDFSPDGHRIVFTSNRRGLRNVFIARANGRRIKALTRCRGSVLRCPTYENPVFSPNGRHVVVLQRVGRGDSILLLRADGRPRNAPSSIDEAGTEEEGFGSRLGVPTWGPQPR